MNAKSVASLSAFVVVTVAVGIAIGSATTPGEWYGALEKPAFTPPSWIFGPVWTVLYIMIGVAGWRIWSIAPRSGVMTLWAIQMALNWLWSPIFFAARMPWLAFAVIGALLGMIALFMFQARSVDRIAAWLFAPYAAWAAFATVLNGSIAVMN